MGTGKKLRAWADIDPRTDSHVGFDSTGDEHLVSDEGVIAERNAGSKNPG